MSIEKVRAEHTIARLPDAEIDTGALLTLSQIVQAADLDGVSGARLARWHDGPVWYVDSAAGLGVFDAVTAQARTPVDEATARAIARAGYAGEAEISAVEYLAEPSWEYRRANPSWQVRFDDGEGTRLYVNASTGQIDARRNDMWRLFDFFWMLHIMDYKERENFNHPLLISMAFLALLTVLAGLALLFVRMRRTLMIALAQRGRR